LDSRSDDCDNRLKALQSQRAKLSLELGGGPENWGISVEQLVAFKDTIKDKMRDYCLDHRLEEGSFKHVCCRHDCKHDHGDADFRRLQPGEDVTALRNVEPNMHTVVQLFIKPRTKANSGTCGLALTLNADKPKKVEKFISHSWSGRFEDFVGTLNDQLLPRDVVFVCSFALPQNLDVGPILDSNLKKTPFALAHKVAKEVLLVVDKDVDVLDRVWVIYELYLTQMRGKHINLGVNSKMAGEEFQKKIEEKAHSLDVRSAKATNHLDWEAIMMAIAGEEDGLNARIRAELEQKVWQLAHNAV
jgi:hypothetical protein